VEVATFQDLAWSRPQPQKSRLNRTRLQTTYEEFLLWVRWNPPLASQASSIKVVQINFWSLPQANQCPSSVNKAKGKHLAIGKSTLVRTYRTETGSNPKRIGRVIKVKPLTYRGLPELILMLEAHWVIGSFAAKWTRIINQMTVVKAK
jgi:hypothetical protein